MSSEEIKSEEGGIETRPILMNSHEFDVLSTGLSPIDNPERLAVMKAYGVEFNSGFAKLKVEGEVKWINTDKEDFGTVLTPETVAERGLK